MQHPQPIETAPHDGTRILAWSPKQDRWIIVSRYQSFPEGAPYWDDLCGGGNDVTHWIPLPGVPIKRTMPDYISLDGSPWLEGLTAGLERFGFDHPQSWSAQEAILVALRVFWAALNDRPAGNAAYEELVAWARDWPGTDDDPFSSITVGEKLIALADAIESLAEGFKQSPPSSSERTPASAFLPPAGGGKQPHP